MTEDELNEELVTPIEVIASTKPVRIKPEYNNIMQLRADVDYEYICSSYLKDHIINCLFVMREIKHKSRIFEDFKEFSENNDNGRRIFTQMAMNLFDKNAEHDILQFEHKEMKAKDFYAYVSDWSGNKKI